MNDLEQNIIEALAGNPRVHPDEISVRALGGDVILRGTVGSVVQREEAVRTSHHVTGVKSLTDRLRLGLLDVSRRADADTEAAVLDALNADTAVRASDIDVTVRDGAVTVSGLVDLVSQRQSPSPRCTTSRRRASISAAGDRKGPASPATTRSCRPPALPRRSHARRCRAPAGRRTAPPQTHPSTSRAPERRPAARVAWRPRAAAAGRRRRA